MIISDEKMAESLEFIEAHASEAGALKGKCNAYDYQLKIIEAEGMRESTEKPVEARRASARTSDEYQNLVKKISEAQTRFHDLQSQITFHYARLDCWRSENANRRGIH
jgi:hypothetical protein